MLPLQRWSEDFFLGFHTFWEGMAKVREDRALRRYAYIPSILNGALFLFGLYLGFFALPEWIAAFLAMFLTPEAGIWWDLLYYPTLILVFISFVLFLVYGLYLVAMIVASPFLSLLAERALMEYGLIEKKPFRIGHWLWMSLKMLWISLWKSLIFILIGLLLLILSFVPGLNFLSAWGVFITLAFDSFDYSFEVMEMGLRERFRYLRRNLMVFNGVAAAMGLTLLIPGLNFFLFPLSVVGGAGTMKKLSQRSGRHRLTGQ